MKTDIVSPFSSAENRQGVLFTKGSRIKLWVESSSEWIRVKAYLASERREQARGLTIIYLFEEDIKKDEKIVSVLADRIAGLLTKQ